MEKLMNLQGLIDFSYNAVMENDYIAQANLKEYLERFVEKNGTTILSGTVRNILSSIKLHNSMFTSHISFIEACEEACPDLVNIDDYKNWVIVNKINYSVYNSITRHYQDGLTIDCECILSY